MAVQIEFYKWGKRNNSTKQPHPKDSIAGTGDYTAYCEIKQPCSILAPSISINPDELQQDPHRFTYCYIYDFGRRFYFIRDWSYDSGLWWATLEVDALASWRDEIGDTTQYVLRSAAAFDGAVQDTYYPSKASVTLRTTYSGIVPWVDDIEQGTFVLGIINSDQTGVGGVSYYAFTAAEFRALNAFLLNDVNWLGWISGTEQDISPQLLKTLFNPYQYITSCMWFPVPIAGGGTVKNLRFGWWECPGISCHTMPSKSYRQIRVTLKLPKHPQAAARGKYLNLSPYTRYMLDFRPFGQLPIDPAPFIDSTELQAIYRLDYVTGEASLTVSPTANFEDVVRTAHCQLAVPIQLGHISRDYLNMVSTTIGTVGGVAGSIMSGNIGGAITTAASGVESVLKSAMPQVQTTGTNGNTAEFGIQPTLSAQFFPLVDESNTHRGRPLCQERKLSTLPGYNMVADPDISLPATQAEKDTILSYLAGGFYWE